MDIQPDGVGGYKGQLAYDAADKAAYNVGSRQCSVVVRVGMGVRDIPDDRDEEEKRFDDCTSDKSLALFACKLVPTLD